MFQRLKGAIDSRIAEEQARQKTIAGSSTPVSRSNSTSTTRRSSSRTESPSTRPRRAKPKEGDGSPARGPDPSEFENAFVIEEDESEEPSGEKIVDEKKAAMAETSPVREAKESDDGKEKSLEKGADSHPKTAELPADVKAKLQKLENLQSKYKDLLRSYRVAHARAVSIEPFEKALKENTPLTSIADPDSLVEYLAQLNMKGDMVMDEFKRVSADRDNYKKKFEDSEKETTAARQELEVLKSSQTHGTTPTNDKVDTLSMADTMSSDTPAASVKSPVSSVLNMFSPKQKPQSAADNKDVSEDFFSYDEELPKLQAEVKEKSAEIEGLRTKLSGLEKKLEVEQESSSGLIANLETATRELNESKEAISASEGRLEQIRAQTEEITTLKGKLETTEKEYTILKDKLGSSEKEISALKTDLTKQRQESAKKVAALGSDIQKQKELDLARKASKESNDKELESAKEASKAAEDSREKLSAQVNELERSRETDAKKIQELSDSNKTLMDQLREETGSHLSHADDGESKPLISSTLAAPAPAVGGGKKKRNKKKKGGVVAAAAAVTEASAEKESESTPPTQSPAAAEAQAEISRLKEEIVDRDVQIEKLQSKRKTEADLREELENMQDNFLTVGQEHVEAKERIKELQGEKTALQERITKLESEIEAYKSESQKSDKVGVDFKKLTAEYEDLKLKSATLQTDLGAAQQLATSRYRDLTDLRDVLQKAQPELKSLREESLKLKSTKDELATRTSELRRLEAREKDLRSDVNSFKKQAADSQGEIRTLNEKVKQETNGRLRAEDQSRIAQRDMRKSDAEKVQLAASWEKSAVELSKIQEEAGKLRVKVRDLEDQVTELTSESKGLREEVDLRGSQYNNAQGLLGSMRDQSQEMAMQLKEAKSQSESLEEELAEVQRLLSERTREGETMRRLLADVDDRAEAKVREMRERMEAAIEERDRAEDEASTNGRRKAREIEELRTKVRDLERDLKRATDDRDELQQSEKEWKRRRDDLEGVSERAEKEVSDIRSAMGELRNALDGSEKQVRDAEKQRTDFRRVLEEASQRYEKLHKEFKVLQAKQSKMNDLSSRSSIDSGRAGSPGPAAGSMDYVYLKTILLQFLELKDKNIQKSLVNTILGQLLHMDQKDKDKWTAAITSR